MTTFLNEFLEIFKDKTYKIFEYLIVLLFLSNIFPQHLHQAFESFSDNLKPIIVWLNSNWSVNKTLLVYCLLVTLSILRLIFHLVKTGEAVLVKGLDAGILYKFNTIFTFILLILSNIFPSLITWANFNHVFQTFTSLIFFPLMIFWGSFVYTQFLFIIQIINKNEVASFRKDWFNIIINICITCFFTFLLQRQLVGLISVLFELMQCR
jgi:hypothetical protein